MIAEKEDQNSELSQWFKGRTQVEGSYPYSILIYSPCLVCQPRIAESLAVYLNEYDDLSDGSSWLFLNDERREQVRLNSYIDPDQPIDADDLDSFLFSYGNIVFESTKKIAHNLNSDHIFKVYLSCKEPEDSSHDMWLNAKRIDPDTLRLMIAGSFLEWSRRNPDWQSLHSVN